MFIHQLNTLYPKFLHYLCNLYIDNKLTKSYNLYELVIKIILWGGYLCLKNLLMAVLS